MLNCRSRDIGLSLILWVRRKALLGSPRELFSWLDTAKSLIGGDHSIDFLRVLGHEIIDPQSALIGVRSPRSEPQLMMHAASTFVSEAIFVEESGIKLQLARCTVSILMPRTCNEDRFRCLHLLLLAN
jgi:hypothetical protein